jgi:hypothetical protein
MGCRLGVAGIVAAILAVGCAHAAAPPPPPTTPAPTANITTSDLLIDIIDGRKMRAGVFDAPTRFVVAAGRHEIGVSRRVSRAARSEYGTVCLEATAGHVYLVRPLVQADNSWTTVIVDTTTNTPMATICATVPEPIVAVDGVAGDPSGAAGADATVSAPPAPEAPPLIEERFRRDRAGRGLMLRTGVAVGGEPLIIGHSDDGSEVSLDAGTGGIAAFGAVLTPLWVRRRVGFGAGLEIGVKQTELAAADIRASFVRFPLLVTMHVMARIAGSWYGRLGAGIERHFGGEIAGETAGGRFVGGVRGLTGSVAELGLYRLFGRRGRGAVELSLRSSAVRYSVGDGSSLGILFAVYFNP